MEVIENVDVSGNTISLERYERTIPIASFDHDVENKLHCRGCPNMGANLSCPPYSPTFSEYIDGAKRAKVICLRLSLEYYNKMTAEERYGAGFRIARGLLVNELLENRRDGYVVAGSGACTECEPCAAEEGGEICNKPKAKIYSLESLGVNVVSLVKGCFDIDLEWSSDEHTPGHVCAVGAVFLSE